ncbi:MAG: trypsin-like peptidase domain-containing protein [Candidatus Sacchiramonaceae bacterium]|nr:trypsin-like peptidase domain-containing protein [Candidatus Saccharimonadaceae bacterium]
MKQERTPKNIDQKTSRNIKIIVVTIFIVLVATITTSMVIRGMDIGQDIARTSTTDNDGNSKEFTGEAGSIEGISKKLSPSVVSVLTTSETSGGLFFSSGETAGAGTGVIVSKDGYILTNKHVVEGSKEISVVLATGDTYENVQIVAQDPLNDIAFIKIDGVEDLSPAELGDSKTLKIGQQVIAIGNALGQYQNSVTSGIISGTNRSVMASRGVGSRAEQLTDMVQTDASINSGNSGGPLVNATGQVIGINTAVASNAQGIGFAIPIGATKGMLNQILETGEAKRAFIGVNYIQITPEVAKRYDLEVKNGAYIYTENGQAVVSGGPAARAGIRSKDIITKINGVEVGEKGSVGSLTAEYKAGDRIKVTILRSGQEREMTVELGSYPNQ